MHYIKDWSASSLLIQLAILLMTLLISFLTGTQYAIASRLFRAKTKEVAGKTYLADMAGSAFGILITSVFLLPLFGLNGTGLILLAFNTASIANVYLRTGRV
ncbi:MAG: hypothetical protein U5Q03_02360 [Bacteroidota bacterium]|nr:hypothetical protein [Bacteroidota bacterium]